MEDDKSKKKNFNFYDLKIKTNKNYNSVNNTIDLPPIN